MCVCMCVLPVIDYTIVQGHEVAQALRQDERLKKMPRHYEVTYVTTHVAPLADCGIWKIHISNYLRSSSSCSLAPQNKEELGQFPVQQHGHVSDMLATR